MTAFLYNAIAKPPWTSDFVTLLFTSQFSLISGFLQYLFAKPKVNVLLIGLDHAGKTTLLERIKTQFGNMPGIPPEKIPSTIGMNLAKINYKGTQVIIWDLGGQIKMRNIWERYYETAHAIIFVVDSADVARLEEAKLAYGTPSPRYIRTVCVFPSVGTDVNVSYHGVLHLLTLRVC